MQLDQAGIKVAGPDARISDDAKLELLTHLRRATAARKPAVTARRARSPCKRKTQSELKLASNQGRARTVNVEVRRKRTYIKRDVLEEQARAQQDELDSRKREAEEAARARDRARRGRAPRARAAGGGEPPPRRGGRGTRARAQEEARRAAEQRTRDDEARRTREREEPERRRRREPQPHRAAAPVADARRRPSEPPRG